MSDIQPTSSSPSTDDSRLWPDLSQYGVTLGEVKLDGGKRALVFSDENGKYAHIARNMGFGRTRWPGLWVRNETRIEPSSFKAAFPKVALVRRSLEDISTEILGKIRERVDAAAQHELPGFSVIDPLEAASSAAGAKGRKKADSGAMIDIRPLAVEASPCGINRLGEEVFQNADGSRFTRLDDAEGQAKIRRETQRVGADPEVAGLFLRGDTPQALDVAADGLVHAMATGRTVRVDDFVQFFRAVTNRELAQNVDSDPEFNAVVSAVDRARVRRLAKLAGNPDADAFAAALRLHEAAQYYSLIRENRMTPLPMSVVLQHIASAMPAESTVRVANAPRGEFSIFSAGSFKEAQEGSQQDILLGAYEGRPLDQSYEAFGTVVNREDHAGVLQMLQDMNPRGLGIYVVEGDGIAGRIGPSSRRFLDAVATHHQIEGIVDIDGQLTGTPGAPPKRIIIVGGKHETPGHGGLPPAIPYVTDYENLWRWGDRILEAIRQPGSVPYSERGAVSKEVVIESGNSYQSPYIPTSTLSDPQLMVPRNLASPLRRAMIEIQRTTPHTDEWLAQKLETTVDELKAGASAEQADAVVMGLHRLESGLGFMVADQTGIGKGRILAMLAKAQRLKGEPVVFLTEKAELFTDFWRDVEDTNSEEVFQNILIINDDVEMRSTRTGEVVARSAPRDEVEKVLRSMKLPEGVDLVLATYSQFNRDPVKAVRNHSDIDLDAATKRQVSAAAQRMIDRAKKWRADEGKKALKAVTVEAVDVFSDPAIAAKLPLATVKAMWIGRAVTNATLIMDESHNASGEVSQTALNLDHATMRADSVIYSSATFARREKNMRIYRRLFPPSVDVEALHETLKKGGEPLQEALSSMLAEDGALVRREHDLSMLKFNPHLDVKRSARNEQYADQLAEILAAMTSLTQETRNYSDALSDELRAALMTQHALEKDDPSLKDVGVVKRGSIGNSLYTAMRSFLTIIKNDLVVERAVSNMREGRKPVIVIEHTLEAELNRTLQRAATNGLIRETDEGLVAPRPSFRTVLRDMLEDMCQVSLDGRDLEIRKQPDFANIIRMIEQKIDAFPDLPTSPLDYVRQGIEKAGYKCAELSGRQRRTIDLGNSEVLVQKIPKAERKSAKDRFNNGDSDAIILTRAGNSGISLHSSHRFVDTRQRVLIEAEVPEDVIVRTQFFGRVNRNGQMSHPIIETLSSDLPAENRLLALQNNKLRKMSANITANRDNAAITKDIADILNSVGNEVAFRFLELNPELATKLDISMPDQAERESENFDLYGDKYVSTLFSRMIMLPVAQQRQIIEEVTTEFEVLVEELEARGENPLKPKFYDVHAKKTSSESVELSASSLQSSDRPSTFDRPVTITTIEYKEYSKPMPREALFKAMSTGKDRFVDQIQEEYGADFARTVAKDSDAYPNLVIDGILDRREKLMQAALSQRHATVADALAEEKNNMVKAIQWKTDKIIEVMGTLRIGSTIKLVDGLWSEEVSAVVTSLGIPRDRDICVPSRYRVSYAVPGRGYVRDVALSQLIDDPGFAILEDKPSEKTLQLFDTVRHQTFTVERPVLDGNLFRAAEMSIQTGLGTQAHYSDEHGMANRAVVLPIGVKKQEFSHLPLRIHDWKLAEQFFQDVTAGILYSTSQRGDKLKGFKLRKEKHELIVSVPGNQTWTNWLKNNPEVMEVTGAFAGSRSELFAAIPAAQAGRLLQAIYKAGVTMYAHTQDVAHTKELSPMDSGRYMPQAEREQLMGAITSRGWFIEKLGGDAKVVDTKKIAPKDPMAEFDNQAPSKRGLRAA